MSDNRYNDGVLFALGCVARRSKRASYTLSSRLADDKNSHTIIPILTHKWSNRVLCIEGSNAE